MGGSAGSFSFAPCGLTVRIGARTFEDVRGTEAGESVRVFHLVQVLAEARCGTP
ncbi:hypothetical protein [Geothrix sp. 21YS21S-2]|uniref:hypothetical protein n=1 Tax=Geothrix sp. 21YS21S-2 TaxID=3068893 RepID=UPI0027B98232|nr:hypothetical protein [Geothrix sp. 21YS21S-2]